eukprot:Nk52_evm42s2192 gene=Nk52_evmTU42s2192
MGKKSGGPLKRAVAKARNQHQEKQGAARGHGQKVGGVTGKVPVKGLQNLGNTCFFNSVMQNLNQIEMLQRFFAKEEGLLHKRVKGVKEFYCFDDVISKDNDRMDLCLPGAEHALSDCLSDFLKTMDSSSQSVINPSNLFYEICKHAKRFKTFDQQDSHELLRYLLDAAKIEDSRRIKKAILKHFNLVGERSVSPDEDLKAKLKEYGGAIATYVDNIFGGTMMSNVVCDEKGHVSQTQSEFLDISVPLQSEVATSGLAKVRAAISKHQLKKMKKEARGKRKGKNRSRTSESLAEEEVDSIVEGINKLTVEERAEVTGAMDSILSAVEKGAEKLVNGGSISDEELDECDVDEQTQNEKEKNPWKTIKDASEGTKAAGEVSLMSCLSSFFARDFLKGENRYSCEDCAGLIKGGRSKEKVLTDATKGFLIKRPPKVLTVHIKRFEQTGRSLRKVNTHVRFETSLDISPFCSYYSCKNEVDSNGSIEYTLSGIVEHSGSLNGGHYVAYVRSKKDGIWYHISDSMVSTVSEQRVLNRPAYLLFYERKLKNIRGTSDLKSSAVSEASKVEVNDDIHSSGISVENVVENVSAGGEEVNEE